MQIAHSQQKLKAAEEMPGRYGLPFLGETLSIFGDEELYYWQHFQQYGPVFKTRILGQKFAFLIGPEANRLVLLEQADHVSTTLGWFFLKSLFGNGLLFMEGEAHCVARRLMYPAFHGRAIALIPSYQNVLSHCRNCFTKLFLAIGDRVSSWEKHSATRSLLTVVPQPTSPQNAP